MFSQPHQAPDTPFFLVSFIKYQQLLFHLEVFLKSLHNRLENPQYRRSRPQQNENYTENTEK